MVTQLDIARRCGVDVSTVNKILNEKQGPVFFKETIKKVKKTAKELGYAPKYDRRKALVDFIRRIFNPAMPPAQLAALRNVGVETVQEAWELVKRG